MKYVPLVLRNLMRSPLRTLLTVIAVALAISLVSLLRTLPAGMDRAMNNLSSNSRLSVTNESGLAYPLPYAYLGKIASLDGVEAAASWTWLAGAYDVDEGLTFPSFAIEPEGLAGVWPDWPITPEAHQAFARQRNAALVGADIMKRYRWKIGDLVTLVGTGHFPVKLEFQIVGEIGKSLFLLQREYLDQALQAQGSQLDSAPTLWIRARDPAVAARLQQEIEALFRNSPAEAVAQTEKGYFGTVFSSLADVLFLVLIVTGLVALCVVFIAGNTASLAIRERHTEIGLLRALGFPRRTVLGLLVGETTLLAGLAGALGVGSAIALTGWLRASRFAVEFPVLSDFSVNWIIVISSLGFSLAVGIVAGLLPSIKASRVEPAQALRMLD